MRPALDGSSVLGCALMVVWCGLAASCAPHPSPERPTSGTSNPNSASADEATLTVPSETTAPSESSAPPASAPIYRAIVDAPDRSPEDRALDAGRHPARTLEFFGIQPGMHVADLVAGGGYTTELLARTVGEDGKVYGQNPPFILQRFAEGPWSERLKKPAMRGVQRVDSEMDDPLPGHDEDLDAVFMVLFYHDTVWLKTDRSRMNRAIFSALKPGGLYAVIDHSAQAGKGVTQAETLHRIEESVVISEITEAGFVLGQSGDFLRNSADTRDWNASPRTAGERRGTSDRFVLLFRKPQALHPDPHSDSPTTPCSEPRRQACTKQYAPVCGHVDTGVRCIKAPCPSTEEKTFGNACMACADPKVLAYSPGACTKDAK